jgi:hypothetical protein
VLRFKKNEKQRRRMKSEEERKTKKCHLPKREAYSPKREAHEKIGFSPQRNKTDNVTRAKYSSEAQ